MSQDIAQENNHPPYLPSDVTVAPSELNRAFHFESRIVEGTYPLHLVPNQKKKIQVIEIYDSEEKEVKMA